MCFRNEQEVRKGGNKERKQKKINLQNKIGDLASIRSDLQKEYRSDEIIQKKQVLLAEMLMSPMLMDSDKK